MKILILEGTSKLGGAQFDNILIQKSNNPEFYYTTVLPDKGDLFQKFSEENKSIKVISPPVFISTSFYFGSKKILNPLAIIINFFGYILFSIKLSKFISKNNFDLVVTNGMNPHFYGGLAAKFSNKPVIFRLMDVISNKMMFGFAVKLFELFAKFVRAKIIVPSKSVSTLMFSEEFCDLNTEVIYNATDTLDFNPALAKQVLREEYQIDKNTLVFGCYSRLVPWKGQKVFIDAAISYLRDGFKAKFLIVGGSLFDRSDFLDDLINQVERSGYTKDILFTGFRYDMANCMFSSDVIVVPSIHPDPCPRVMVESMALKKPIIGSNIGGIPEVVVDNKTGLIFEAGDFNDLKNCFSYFNENRNQIISMGEEGYARQHSKYKLVEYQKNHEKYFNIVKNEY